MLHNVIWNIIRADYLNVIWLIINNTLHVAHTSPHTAHPIPDSQTDTALLAADLTNSNVMPRHKHHQLRET